MLRVLSILLLAAGAQAAEPLLPDLTVRKSTLYDNDIVTNIIPGHKHLRLSNTTPNIGAGRLHLYGVTPGFPGPVQDVNQRIWLDDGSFFDQPAGQFIFHPSHNHIHIEGWSAYRLREILPGDGVGQVIAEGAKTSFCVIDLQIFDNTLPGFSATPQYTSCGTTVQGLSVGWADIYSKSLDGQNIDITGVPDGVYWLEAEVDPDNHIIESDDSNNAARIKVTIGTPTPIVADKYEPNDSRSELATRPIGGPNSPALGPCAPLKVVSSLNVHQSGNDDWWRFYFPATGSSSDYVRIEFVDAIGDLDMTLVNANGSPVASSTSAGDFEQISLNGRAAGYYDLRVYGYGGDLNDDYTLTVDPPSNGAPQIDVLDPPTGEIMVQHGVETYTTTWQASDPEGNPTWVTIYLNRNPTLDGHEVLMPTSVHTDGGEGLHIINTSYLGIGSWYVYAEITDGGTVTGEWADGTLFVWDPLVSTDLPQRPSRLHAPSPNPFNPRTVLRLELAQRSLVDWAIYDTRGARVRRIELGNLEAGLHEFIFDGRDDRGRRLASGVYYVGVHSPQFRERQKLVLVE